MFSKFFNKPYQVRHSTLEDYQPKRFRGEKKAKEFASKLASTCFRRAREECIWRNIPDITKNYQASGQIEVVDGDGSIVASEPYIVLKPDSELSFC
jgi:hypothetical protein